MMELVDRASCIVLPIARSLREIGLHHTPVREAYNK
jgi:hypothetical protein